MQKFLKTSKLSGGENSEVKAIKNYYIFSCVWLKRATRGNSKKEKMNYSTHLALFAVVVGHFSLDFFLFSFSDNHKDLNDLCFLRNQQLIKSSVF